MLTCARASRRLIRCGAFVSGTAFRRRASRRLSLTGILGTGRRRNLPFRTELRLQFGQLIIFELHEPLQFFQLSLQIIQPIFQLVILTPAGIEAFLSYRKLVTKRLTTIGRAGFGSCRRLPGISSHKTEVVSGVATGGRSTGLGATGRIQLTSTCYSASSALTPGSVLLGDLGDRFSLRTAGYLLCIRQTKHLPALHSIDIAADEGIGVQILDRQHGLMDRAVTTITLRDIPQRIASRYLVFATGLRWRCHGNASSGRRRCGCRTRRCGANGLDGASRGRNRQLRRSSGSSFRRIKRRVQQQRVLAQQATVRPEDLYEKIEIWLAYRLARRNLDDTFSVWTQYGRELQVGQKVLAINTGTIEFLKRGENRNHLSRCQVFGIEQLDFGDQRLIQRRLKRDLSQPKRMGHFCSQRGSSRDCQHQIANPNHYLIPCLSFSRTTRGSYFTARATLRWLPFSDKPFSASARNIL